MSMIAYFKHCALNCALCAQYLTAVPDVKIGKKHCHKCSLGDLLILHMSISRHVLIKY